MANGWTSERRARQAELIQRWRPWEKSTGPTTLVGKAIVSRNGWRGSIRPQLRAMAKALKDQNNALDRIDL